MKNTYKKIIISTFAFLFIGINSAHAYVPGVWEPQRRLINDGNQPAFVSSPIVDEPITFTQVNNNNQNSSSSLSSTNRNTNTNSTSNNTVKNTSTSSNKTDTTNKINSENTGNQFPSEDLINGNNLTALSLAGSGGFMPSSIWQWILVIFLILVIIIVARLLSKKPSPNDPHAH